MQDNLYPNGVYLSIFLDAMLYTPACNRLGNSQFLCRLLCSSSTIQFGYYLWAKDDQGLHLNSHWQAISPLFFRGGTLKQFTSI